MPDPAAERVVVGPLHTNCYLLPAPDGVIVVDPGADAGRILGALAGRPVAAIVLTHCHFDHVLAVPGLLATAAAPVYAHPSEAAVWEHELAHLARHGHFDAGTMTAELLRDDPASLTASGPLWDGHFQPVPDGWTLAGGTELAVLPTPGHTPGGITLATPHALYTGDTLFPGGPGLTGWPLSDFDTIMASVRGLLTRDPHILVRPGHGPATTIGAERPHVEQWAARGW